MARRIVERVWHFDVSPKTATVPAGTNITLTETWPVDRWRGRLYSGDLDLRVVVNGWGRPFQPVEIMPPHTAEVDLPDKVEFITNLLIEVRPKVLKGHSVGRLYMNAMIAWARRYHLEKTLGSISTWAKRDEKVNMKLIEFYSSFGIPFALHGDEYAKASTPVPIALLNYVAMPHLSLRGRPTLIWRTK